jgi:hypothetical protein
MKGSEAFRLYYEPQGIVANNAEWDSFMEAFQTSLPVSFTVVEEYPGGFGRHLQTLLESGLYSEYLSPLQWYPGGIAWQTMAPRSQWSAAFKDFLKVQTENGTIIRQETVRSGS